MFIPRVHVHPILQAEQEPKAREYAYEDDRIQEGKFRTILYFLK